VRAEQLVVSAGRRAEGPTGRPCRVTASSVVQLAIWLLDAAERWIELIPDSELLGPWTSEFYIIENKTFPVSETLCFVLFRIPGDRL
jgi:hypothetical protein